MFVLERYGPDQAYTLAALFDGHGGRGTVDFVSHSLPRNLAAILRNPEAQTDAERALRAAFLLTDVQTARFVADTSGSTAVCCLATRDAERGGALTLVLANCGDSRAVLCRNG
jgi:serine/threonine protein phosphatase PrpC